ncbi:MAG: hypothetical protein P8P44_03130, partial [Alphaproteobacteria bacterium]|nr:hypothetical protein [Alphaproteobacteria bacterium]
MSGRVVTHWIDLHRAKAQKTGAKTQKKSQCERKRPAAKKKTPRGKKCLGQVVFRFALIGVVARFAADEINRRDSMTEGYLGAQFSPQQLRLAQAEPIGMGNRR